MGRWYRGLAVAVVVVAFGAAGAPAPAATWYECQVLDDGVPGRDDAIAAAERRARCLVNAARRSVGLPPLRLSRKLSAAGRAYARRMTREGFFDHRSPDGGTLAARIRRSGYAGGDWFAVGEALGSGTSVLATPTAIVTGWIRSPAHRRVLALRRARHIGVGVAYGAAAYGVESGATYVLVVGRRARR